MTIDRIEVRVTDLTVRVQRETSSGAYDTGPSGTLLGKPVLVAIHADGVTGYGQIRPISPGHFMPDTVHSMVGAITDIYGPRLIGRELLDYEAVLAMFDQALPANMNARAAIDHALHDAAGKALKLPAYRLLGGLCQPRIPLEWSVSMAADPRKMIEDAERAIREFGIRVMCLKAGGKGGWMRDVKNFIAVREAIGMDAVIGIDPNEGWTVSEATRAIHALRAYRLDYLEQPVKRQNVSGMAAIRRELNGVPLMADEGVMTLGDAYALARAEAVDALDHRRDVGRLAEHHDAREDADPEPGPHERRPDEVQVDERRRHAPDVDHERDEERERARQHRRDRQRRPAEQLPALGHREEQEHDGARQDGSARVLPRLRKP